VTATVRRAGAADAPALYRAWQELRRHNSSVDPRIVPAPVTETEFNAGLGEILARPTSVVFLAEVDRRLAGFVRAGVEQNQPDRLPEQHVGVGYVWVDPSVRRQGIGRLLFEAVRDWAAARDDVAHLEMTVLSGDASAEPFWRAMGFTPFITRLWAPLDPGEDA
jgi:GNAT superfamily N-acetyltransferase